MNVLVELYMRVNPVPTINHDAQIIRDHQTNLIYRFNICPSKVKFLNVNIHFWRVSNIIICKNLVWKWGMYSQVPQEKFLYVDQHL